MSPLDATKIRRLSAQQRSPRTTCAGLFVVGTDTAVGKTFVASRIVAALARSGIRVGVYKPAASGCRRVGRSLISDDAVALWDAAGRPGELKAVCPQRFAAPLAPHLAAKEERKEIDSKLLRHGIDYWRQRSDVVIVEGIFLFKREFRAHYDFTIWVECSFETALERALARAQEGLSPENTEAAYRRIYFPAQALHFAEDNPQASAHGTLANDP